MLRKCRMNTSIKKPVVDLKFYRQLFISTFMISVLTVGGGYVIISLLKSKFVDEYGWIDDKETLNLVTVAQSMPGSMAVNASVLLGYNMAGLTGALTALVATILPPLIIISVIEKCYGIFIESDVVRLALKGMQCGATALVLNVAIDLIIKEWRQKLAIPILIALGTFVAGFFFDADLMKILAVDAVLGLLLLRDPKYG